MAEKKDDRRTFVQKGKKEGPVTRADRVRRRLLGFPKP